MPTYTYIYIYTYVQAIQLRAEIGIILALVPREFSPPLRTRFCGRKWSCSVGYGLLRGRKISVQETLSLRREKRINPIVITSRGHFFFFVHQEYHVKQGDEEVVFKEYSR